MIWEEIQKYLNNEFKKLEISNAYFPMFVSEKTLSKEQDHIKGFTPEVAWVTHSGETKLENKLAIRPTSETIIYPYFSKWIKTHKNLPLKINQWCNVVRWEFKDPTPFIRSREFLWHEAHTAHETFEETEKSVQDSLELYYNVYKDLLAVPTIKGVKTDMEKFAGALYTTTVEGFIKETGKGIQAATSHNLDQNFSKMFNIEFDDKDGVKRIPYQTSFGFTTRSIGIMIMTHSDNKGLILPPKIAPIQIVIIPIYSKKHNNENILNYSKKLYTKLKDKFRIKLDTDETNTAGYKYNYYELKGIPLRIEIGFKETETNKLCLFYRNTCKKEEIEFEDNIIDVIENKLNDIHISLFEVAEKKITSSIVESYSFDELVNNIKLGNLVLTPFCDDSLVEEQIKNKCKENGIYGIKTLCKPYQYNITQNIIKNKCFFSNVDAKCFVLWGKSY